MNCLDPPQLQATLDLFRMPTMYKDTSRLIFYFICTILAVLRHAGLSGLGATLS
jgi:hypothetical protein